MSQIKTLTNLDKGKLLRDARKRLGFTQETMAEKLGLDPTYVSQLEKGRRNVDEFYLKRVEEIEGEFNKSNKVKEGTTPYTTTDIRGECHLYLERVMDSCGGDQHRLSWIYIELTKRFPLPNSSSASAAIELLDEAVAGVGHRDQAQPHSREAGGPNVQSVERVSYGAKRSNQKPATPGKVPK